MTHEALGLAFRQATLADADAIARLHAQSWQAHYRGAYPDLFLDRDQPAERIRAWRERMQRVDASRFVELALEGDALLGFICVIAAQDPKWGSLVDNLHVAATAQGRGIGRSLMKHAGTWLEREHASIPVQLFVLDINASARRFYEAMGGTKADVATTEVHGAHVLRWRYTWPSPSALT